MTFDELLNFIEEQGEWLKKKYKDEKDKKLGHLLRLSKLTEEVGELAEQVLGSLKHQRKNKSKKMDSDSVEEEIADVLITTLLLAHVMGVDVKKTLSNRIKKITKRQKP